MAYAKTSNSNKIVYMNEKTNVKLLLPESSFPSKEEGKNSNAGYGIELVQRCDNRAEDTTQEVNTYRTGVSITPPLGFYIEISAQNTLYKHGYFLANSPIIVEPWNSGEIIIPLYKYKEVEDIELPFQAVQFIIKPIVYSHLFNIQVTPDESFAKLSSGRGEPSGIEYIQDPQFNYNQPQKFNTQSRPKTPSRSKNHMF
jgi:hypothetical protein